MLQTKLKDQSWTDTQDPDFISALRVVDLSITELSLTLATMVDYVTQHFQAVSALPIFATAENRPDDKELTNPTQTAGNRATRRAKKRK